MAGPFERSQGIGLRQTHMRNMVYKKHLGKGRHKLDMAPMVDIVFQLLIFFLVATDIRPTEADFTTNLPGEGQGPRDVKEEKPEVSWVYLSNVDEEGNVVLIKLNGVLLTDYPWQELSRRLGGARSANMMLVIDADPSVKLKWIVKALDSAVKAKVPKITFGRPKKSVL